MDSNECMNAQLACKRICQSWALPVAALVLALASLTSGAAEDLSDDLPTSVVMWVCPDEPFADGIGKKRQYRKSFETSEGRREGHPPAAPRQGDDAVPRAARNRRRHRPHRLHADV